MLIESPKRIYTPDCIFLTDMNRNASRQHFFPHC
uniref:Uncharacterized protein n=1 Tax=Anguilla anguilla TaxID=7936 RepID=A0A0E9REN4_ANGAN